MSTDVPNELLSGLGQRLGIPDLGLDERKHCFLSFDNFGINIEVDSARGEFLLYGDLAEFVPDRHEPRLAEFLEANHFAALTGFGNLGLDRQGGRFHLSARYPYRGLTAETLEALLQEFLARSESWQSLLGENSSGEQANSLFQTEAEASLAFPGVFRI